MAFYLFPFILDDFAYYYRNINNRVNNLYIIRNFNGEIDAILSTSLSFIIYEIIFEPILIVSRVHVYSIAIPQIRIK